jgi:hypothetical protein
MIRVPDPGPAILAVVVSVMTGLLAACTSGSVSQASASAQPSSLESPTVQARLDAYGGLADMPSANRGNGMFRLEKFPNRKWMFVDPDNHAFFMTGMYVLDQSESRDDTGHSYAERTSARYGNTGPSWAPAQAKRMQAWGFNTVGPYASVYALATHAYPDWPGDRSNPAKLPLVAFFRPSFYSMRNLNHWAPAAVKDMLAGASQYYTGYRPYDGIADYYDANWEKFLVNELADDGAEIRKSRYKQYVLGVSLDDSDDLFGFGAGPDFATQPDAGDNQPHLGWLVLTMSPWQTVNSHDEQIYADTTVYSKKALHDQLVAKYGTISELNAAWGSNYTTFESAGAPVSGKTIGTGDGSTGVFKAVLPSVSITRFSLQILVDGKIAGGDVGNGTLWGPELKGIVNYSTGEVSINFGGGKIPSRGAAITANYVQNGWGIGSGLMDEDGRPSHPWIGKDFVSTKDMNSAVREDLDAFLFQIADHYFSTGRAEVERWLPGTLFLGPTTLGTWSTPSSRNVLKAASRSLDLMAIGGGWPLSQEELNFIYQYFGDKPIYAGAYRTSNADSAFWRYKGGSGNFATQGERGEDYFKATTALATASYPNGSRPYVGVMWWQYLDNWGEKLNWGLVSLSDNAYDGREDVAGTVPCSKPLEQYRCGGEEQNYGDVITPVEKAHQTLFELVQH